VAGLEAEAVSMSDECQGSVVSTPRDVAERFRVGRVGGKVTVANGGWVAGAGPVKSWFDTGGAHQFIYLTYSYNFEGERSGIEPLRVFAEV
jgi:hypothetical protein